MKSFPRPISLLLVLAFLTTQAQAELRVASLSTITTDLANQVGGRHVLISPIVKAGTDPHEFEPSPSDVKNVAKADLVLFTGKGMEGFLAKLEDAAGGRVTFVDVGRDIPSLTMTEEGRRVDDPHWWHDVGNMKRATRTVMAAFIKTDPAHAADYQRNAEAYLASLNELDRWIRVRMAELPRSQRKLVTSHDALQYFARDYGFVILPIKGVSTGEEPSSMHVRELIEIIRRERVKAVFLESIENSRAVEQVGAETGAKTGGILYSDGLGDTEASTYESMMKHNVSTIVDSLK